MTDKVLPFRLRRGSNPETPRDEDLIRACASGDNGALDDLFRRHGERVHRVIGRLRMVDRKDLDDIVQTTFLEVHRSAGRFEGGAAVGSWILGVAMNVVRHHVRSESRRRLAMTSMARLPASQSAGRPDDQAAQQQAMVRLQAGVDSLPEILRIVFTLCDIEGLKGVEVGRILEVPEGTIWRRLHEARIRLRVCIAGQVSK